MIGSFKHCLGLACLLLLLPERPALAEAGVLIPWNVQHEPDPKMLSLKRVDITVRIDHLHARVAMKQIFQNHSDRVLEGRYVLPLSEHAGIEDFSVWDAEERLIGVVVEKQRGKRLFEQITAQKIDPGLAESEDDKDKGREFALRVAPIPPRGTARVEVVFSEDLIISSMGTLFTLPLAARHYGPQRAEEVHVDLQLDGEWPLAEAMLAPAGLFKWREAPRPGATSLHAEWNAKNAAFEKDVTLELKFGAEAQKKLSALSYRDPTPRHDVSPFGDGTIYKDDRGFFLLQAIAGFAGVPSGRPRDVVLLLDTSLSMEGEKLDRSFAALEYFLSRLAPADRFGLVLWNDEVRPFRKDLSPAGSGPTGEALRFVRESYLGGGTELSQALSSGVDLLSRAPQPGRDRFVVLITDGHPTRGELSYKALGQRFVREVGQKQGAGLLPVRLFVLGVGDDAALPMLRSLADAGNGYFAWAQQGTDAAFKLRTFFDKLGQASWKDVALAVSSIGGLSGIEQVLPSTPQTVYQGSSVTVVGRYKAPKQGPVPLNARIAGMLEGKPYGISVAASLTDKDVSRPWIARAWAGLRVEEILARIAQEGEKEEWVREIIALAKEFHLVTPYTSFIAAPRALLRPRSIQPGDPVLRVKVSPDIKEVVALFPFGLEKGLRYLRDEDLWETRFLAPTWMIDGTYSCSLILTDKSGHKHREEKSFVIDSRAPTVKVKLASRSVHSGEALSLLADSDPDTRRLFMRLGDGPTTELHWDAQRKGSVGLLQVPADLPPGTYPLFVQAEDFAHNVSSTRVDIDVTTPVDDAIKGVR